MTERLHLMVFGAHAADAEIMAGATAAKYAKAGHKVTFVHVTLGEAGHRTLRSSEYAVQKQGEAQRAAEAIGANVIIMPYRDAELEYNRETVDATIDIIRKEKPNIVITHWKGSFHRDHEYTSEIVARATGLASLPSYAGELPAHRTSGLLYAENWEDPYDFSDDLYIDIDDEIYELWYKCISQYELFRGGVSSFPYQQYYQGLFMMRGALAGCKRAEAFMRPKPIIGTKTQWLHG